LVPSRFLWILLLLPSQLMAGWTGISAFFGQSESDWLLQSTLNEAGIGFFGLRIEDKTQSELRIGATAGQFELRLINLLDETAEKYYGRFLSLYLRLPVALTDQVTFHTALGYQLNFGENSVDQDVAEISWSEITINAGLSLNLGGLSLRPFMSSRSVDGDITSMLDTRIFKQNENSSYGVMLDYFVEPSAFIRLMVTTGRNEIVQISFAREL